MTFQFPNIPDREAELIGLVLAQPEITGHVLRRLPKEAFTNQLTVAIWEAMQGLEAGGTRIGIQALRERVDVDPSKFGIPDLPSFLGTCLQRAGGDMPASDLLDVLSETVFDEFIRRQVVEFSTDLIRRAGDKSVNGVDLATAATKKLTAISGQRVQRVGVSVFEAGKRFIEDLQKVESGERSIGFRFGVGALDDLMGPIRDGDFGYIVGPSGHGKSALVRQIARANPWVKHLLITAEETDEDISAKEILAEANVSSDLAYRGGLSAQEMESIVNAHMDLKDAPLHVEPGDDMRISTIESKIQAFKFQNGGKCGCVFLDTIDDLDAEEKGNFSLAERPALSARKLDKLSTKLMVPIIAIGQLTSAYAKRMDISISLADTYGGQAVRNKANWGLMMHRPAQKIDDVILPSHLTQAERDKWLAERANWLNLAEFINLKSRRTAVGKRAKAGWVGPRTSFVDYDESGQEGFAL